MSTLRHQLHDATDGLAFEAELFDASDAAVGIWSTTKRSLICPKAYRRREGFTEAAHASAQRGWPVHLRPTGGGVVPQGPGVVNIALAFNAPRKFTITDSYKLFVEIIRNGYGEQGLNMQPGDTPGSFCDGDWNLSVEGKKLVGTAQRWRPVRGGLPRVLAHALILTEDPREGAGAVGSFHRDLGLDPIASDVHTSTSAAFGTSDIPADALIKAAYGALEALQN